MMEALFAKAGTGAFKWAVFGLAVLALMALIALAGWRAAAAFGAIVETARMEASEARDAHWKAEIAKSNFEMAKRQTDQMAKAMQRDEEARSVIENLQDKLTVMEMENAQMPEGPGGLKRDRVRLLPH